MSRLQLKYRKTNIDRLFSKRANPLLKKAETNALTFFRDFFGNYVTKSFRY